jgi:hypothetical protein
MPVVVTRASAADPEDEVAFWRSRYAYVDCHLIRDSP